MRQLSGMVVVLTPLKKINSLYRRAAKLLISDSTMTTDTKLQVAGLLPLRKHLEFNKAIFMYKIVNGLAPLYLQCLLHQTPSRYTVYRRNFAYPRPLKDIFKSSFSFSGPKLWNSLPRDVKDSATVMSFKRHMLDYL